jgi:Mad3/BUB1 homology region 1
VTSPRSLCQVMCPFHNHRSFRVESQAIGYGNIVCVCVCARARALYPKWFGLAILALLIFAQDHNIGQDFALFYIAYATYLELKGNFGKADAVYKLGLERMAYPVDRLRVKYEELQKRMVKLTRIYGLFTLPCIMGKYGAEAGCTIGLKSWCFEKCQ